MGPSGSKQGRRQDRLVPGWAVTDVPTASEEDLIKAEIEAWNRVHYRSDWFLRRTLGYSILASLAAVYIFWHEAPGGPSVQVLAGLWTALLAAALTAFDYRTRPSNQGWTQIARHIPRHIALAATCLTIGIAAAYGIHTVSTYFDRAPEFKVPAVTTIEKPVTSETPIAKPNEKPVETPITKPTHPPPAAVATSKPVKKTAPKPPAKAAVIHKASAATVARKTARRAKPVRRTVKRKPPKPRVQSKTQPAVKPRRRADETWKPIVEVERRRPKPYHLNVSGG